MENKRPLVYEVPHKAIRNALSQISLTAGNTDYNDKAELNKLKDMVSGVFKILDAHAEHENNVPLKYLEEKIPGSSVFDKEDHVRIEAEMDKVRTAMNNLIERSAKGEDLSYQGNEFYIQFSDFHAQYLQHMLEEERVTQPLLWKYFTDDELKNQEMEIKRNIKPEEMIVMFKYMIPSFTFNARIGMLKEIKGMAPAEFFNALLNVAKSVLSKEDFAKIEKSF